MDKRIDALVSRAITTAEVLNNGRAEDLQVFFDVDALKRLTTAITTPEKLLLACDSAQEQAYEAIRNRDMPRAQAGLVLRDRIGGSGGRRYGDGPDGWRPLD
ncbi:hypothetical protein [Nocardioides sp. SYSU DS0663]|uniref:hypothetical protein n=1 Tax=Nocardioides sp. SYSU DS0663 TaxID=3416445 RepID=UPI003F4B0E2A